MTMDENVNTNQARKVRSNDDYDDDARNDPTTFYYASNANDITNTSIVTVIFWLVAQH
jgi:hypothetical protein